jgi:hypothetical protein
MEKAVEQDPLNVPFRAVFSLVLNLESPDRGDAEAQKAIEIDERHWAAHYAMGINYVRRGELAEARSFAEQSARAAPWLPLTTGLLAGILRRLGENHHADELLTALKPSGLFMYHMVLSEFDAAADCCAKAIAQGDVQPLMWIWGYTLRSTPHWPALARMMNLPPEGRSYGVRQIL